MVDGIELAYEDDGRADDPAIVCLHAIGHGARDFEALRAKLAAGSQRRVIALDWPGHGASGADSEPVSSARFADVLAAFLAAIGVERPILVGNSLGGAAAIELAARDPGAIRGLVVANPGGLFARNVLSRLVVGAFVRFFRAGARGASWFPRAFAAYYRLVLQRPASHAQRARIVGSWREIAPLLESGWRSFGAAESDLRPVAPRVACPVLVAWATGDRFNQLWANRRAIRAFPRARITTYRAGHNPFLETVDEFFRDFVAFERELAS